VNLKKNSKLKGVWDNKHYLTLAERENEQQQHNVTIATSNNDKYQYFVLMWHDTTFCNVELCPEQY